MKTLTTAIFIATSFLLYGQTPFTIDTVITVDSTSKKALMLNAKSVIAESFKDSKEVIQLVDDEQGVIIGKGNYTYQFSQPRFTCNINNGSGTVSFTIKVLVKDNKVKLMLYDFVHVSPKDPYVNLGVVYNTFVYEEGMIRQCRFDIYNDIIAKNKALLSLLASKLAIVKSNDFDF